MSGVDDGRRPDAAVPAPVLPGASVPAPDLNAVSDAVADLATPAARTMPRTEAPSSDVAPVPSASRMPGAVRDDYHHLPTAPVITATTGPDVDGDTTPWEPSAVTPEPRSSIAPWALGTAILALIASFFVGWMLPLGVAAIVAAILALRRLGESRPVAIWALALGAAASLYSAGWLLWAIPQL